MQAWTSACPHCGALAAGVTPGATTSAWSDAPPYQRPAWPPSTTPAGVLIPTPRPRRRRWPVVLLAVVLLGAVTGGGFVAYTTLTDNPYPSKWDPRVKELAAFVERERGLESCDPGTAGPAGRAEGHISGI